jgi:hypothetical protein
MQGILGVGRNARRGATILLAAGASLLALAGTAGAATFTPNTFDDRDGSVDPPNAAYCEPASTHVCSIRDAFEAANGAPGDDEIVLSAGRYELNPDTGGTLYVQSDGGHLLVRGQGARSTTIDGNGVQNSGMLVVQVNPAANAEFRDLAVTGGYYGDNSGSAFRVLDGREVGDGVLTLTRTWIFDNHNADAAGGAIENRGKTTIVQSLLTGNTAGTNGGAIDNQDELTLINSTISDNSAGIRPQQPIGDGGGIYNGGHFSELPTEFRSLLAKATTIPDKTPFLLVENSTITDNHAPNGLGGGVVTNRDQCSFAPSFGGGCGGGPSALALFHNSIVSGNTAQGDANCSGNEPQSSQYASSQGYNLEDGDGCQFTATGDKLAATNVDGLADNGGGTDTHKLKESSVAVDGGDPADCQTVDQRGVARPQRGGCDIGAFELEPLPVQQLPPPVIPAGQPCSDPVPPITTLRNRGLGVGSNRVTLEGSSRDPDPCASGVQRVEVSMARVKGTDLNCRFVRSSTRFVITPFRNCREPVLFVARGTTSWKFTFNVRLSPGKYRAQARGYDVARNKETPKKLRNIIYFTVK